MTKIENGREVSRSGLASIELPAEWGLKKEAGKVRDIFWMSGVVLLLGATDRLSAFDRQIGLVPQRGEILTALSAWWFDHTSDIVPNHMVEVIDPNIMAVWQYPRIDLEIVVRGFNTGSTSTSIWRRYQQGQREFGEIVLPDGMRKNEPLAEAILDPTTKAVKGHDRTIGEKEIIAAGVVSEEEYQELKRISLQLFKRGQELSAEAGLILADTKYEFGRIPGTGRFVLIDEIHTPDSSRFWGAASYGERLARGEEPEIYDKEFVRLWLVSQGYGGEGEPPVLPADIIDELRRRYIFVYKCLTGKKLKPAKGNRQEQITANVKKWLGHQ